MDRLVGKVALVTGAAVGIGHATASLFAREGATVFAGVHVRDPDVPFEDQAIELVQLDVTSDQDWRRVVTGILERHKRLDILVNNAGIIGYEAVEELDLEAWHRTIAVDQTGVFLGMREVVPPMRAAGGGSIINISSIWGSVAIPGAHAYHAAKGAVRNMTKNVAMTHARDGVRVNSVHPGFIKTPLTDAQDPEVNNDVVAATPMQRAGEATEIAYGCLYLASDESSFVTGAELVIDGGYLAQ